MTLYNQNAEQSVLGAVILDPKMMVTVASALNDSDFYFAGHRVIYGAMLDIHEKGGEVDLVTLAEKLGDQLENAGGISYLTELSTVPTASRIEQHIEIIKAKAQKRKIVEYAQSLQKAVHEDGDLDEIMQQASSGLMDIDSVEADGDFIHIEQSVVESLNNITDRYHNDGSITGVPTGHAELDDMTAGFQPGNFVIIAARPSVGKTALALDIGKNAAKAGKTVGFVSLEMPHAELTDRLLASEGMIDSYKIKTGKLTENDWQKLMVASGVLSDLPIYIEDSNASTVAEIRSKATKLKQEKGLDMLIIDYLQLLSGNGRENRQQEVSRISRTLKQLAGELEIPIIALSQLSRSVEQREDKRPMLSDLRESGSLEQDSDIVMFLYRDVYYDKESKDQTIEVIISKHRNGSLGTVELAFLKEYSKFVSIKKEDY